MAKQLSKEECKKVSFFFGESEICFYGIAQLFQEFDNGNGILSLAEVDRAIIHWHPEFGTNRQAMMRAFKAADTNGVCRIFLSDNKISHLIFRVVTLNLKNFII
jgi:hypothetical protein